MNKKDKEEKIIMKEVKAVFSKELSREYDNRYVIIDSETGATLDDAQGYGYRSPQSAYAGYSYKTKPKKKKKTEQTKEKRILSWLKKNRDFWDSVIDCAFVAEKEGLLFTAKNIKEMLDDYEKEKGADDVNIFFTPKELLKVCQKYSY